MRDLKAKGWIVAKGVMFALIALATDAAWKMIAETGCDCFIVLP
jgi:hypothetical protein